MRTISALTRAMTRCGDRRDGGLCKRRELQRLPWRRRTHGTTLGGGEIRVHWMRHRTRLQHEMPVGDRAERRRNHDGTEPRGTGLHQPGKTRSRHPAQPGQHPQRRDRLHDVQMRRRVRRSAWSFPCCGRSGQPGSKLLHDDAQPARRCADARRIRKPAGRKIQSNSRSLARRQTVRDDRRRVPITVHSAVSGTIRAISAEEVQAKQHEEEVQKQQAAAGAVRSEGQAALRREAHAETQVGNRSRARRRAGPRWSCCR
jgi:hypothetical protein